MLKHIWGRGKLKGYLRKGMKKKNAARDMTKEIQGEVGEALVGLFEKELGNLLEKAL